MGEASDGKSVFRLCIFQRMTASNDGVRFGNFFISTLHDPLNRLFGQVLRNAQDIHGRLQCPIAVYVLRVPCRSAHTPRIIPGWENVDGLDDYHAIADLIDRSIIVGVKTHQ